MAGDLVLSTLHRRARLQQAGRWPSRRGTAPHLFLYLQICEHRLVVDEAETGDAAS
ncbi:MAG: hypothetical protein U0V56_10275 [Actinomycetota bacterium]